MPCDYLVTLWCKWAVAVARSKSWIFCFGHLLPGEWYPEQPEQGVETVIWKACLEDLSDSVFPELYISSTGKVLDGQVQSLRQQVQEAGIGKGLVVIFKELESYWEDFTILYNSYYFIILFWPTSPSWLHFASGQHLQAALGAAGSEGFLKSSCLSVVVLIRLGMSPAESMVFLRFFPEFFLNRRNNSGLQPVGLGKKNQRKPSMIIRDLCSGWTSQAADGADYGQDIRAAGWQWLGIFAAYHRERGDLIAKKNQKMWMRFGDFGLSNFLTPQSRMFLCSVQKFISSMSKGPTGHRAGSQ